MKGKGRGGINREGKTREGMEEAQKERGRGEGSARRADSCDPLFPSFFKCFFHKDTRMPCNATRLTASRMP